MFFRRFLPFMLCLLALAFDYNTANAQQYDPDLFDEMQWRMIGPFRGGRTKAAAGVPEQPNVFYIGVVNGGVWKSTDYGHVWKPIFDDQPTGSDALSSFDVVHVPRQRTRSHNHRTDHRDAHVRGG